jgi:multidrug resistance efflux pump
MSDFRFERLNRAADVAAATSAVVECEARLQMWRARLASARADLDLARGEAAPDLCEHGAADWDDARLVAVGRAIF